MIQIDELAERLKELRQSAVAITDHGNLYGSCEAYKLLKDAGIKCIIGCECYICDDRTIKNKESKTHHLVLLAKDETGRQNLQKIVTESTKHKYRGKPRIDFSLLTQYHDGLICCSACMAGELQRALEVNDNVTAEAIATRYKTLFADDYYLEYQSHAIREQQDLNLKIVNLANKLNIKYIVTCDAHYLKREDQKYHSVFVQVGTVREVGETYNDCYVQSEQEVVEICKSTAEYNAIAIQNTQDIADKCNAEYPLSAPIIPHQSVPTQFKSEEAYLKYLCNQGYKNKGFDKLPKSIQHKYKERAKYEINAVTQMGFEGYYLLVHSYVSSAKRRGIARGSAGGSLLAYLCGIVDIDPIKFGLYFERFIDVGAIELLKNGTITRKQLKIPDVDTDFSPTDRDKVMEFIINTYGENNVVCLGQFGYMWAKGAIKDIGKVLGVPFEITNQMTKNLDKESIKDALELGLLDEYKSDYPELFEYASRLSGLPKSFGIHPCGRVICMRNADYYNALEYDESKNIWVLQGDMHTADDLGLVKIDLLGLRTLDVIYDVLDMIGKDYNYIAPHLIDMEDQAVWEEFAQGHTDLIFQFESGGMKRMLKDMECRDIESLGAANALYRPGAMSYISNYVNRKKGQEEIAYLHQDLEPILASSYGIIVYQEQLIEIGRLSGLKNPDELRQATAKKKPKLMAKIEPEFKQGLVARGWTQEQVDKLWTDILEFARYSFNKSHSAAYALTAYISMFLKTHHPVEFITATINSHDGDTTKIANVISEAKRMGVKYQFNDWRNANGRTICKDNTVMLGTDTIKGCSANLANGLNSISANFNGTFLDLVIAANTNQEIGKVKLSALIKLGMFEEFGCNHKLLQIHELYQNIYQSKVFNKAKLPVDIGIIKKYARETEKQFRDIDNQGLFNELYETIENKPMPVKEQIQAQLELLGYVNYTNPKLQGIYFVQDINAKYSPRITLYDLSNGELQVMKMQSKIYGNNPFSVGDVIQILYKEQRNKSQKIDGKWCKIVDEYDTWISSYKIRGDNKS